MASISSDRKTGLKTLQFFDPAGVRKSIRLGKVSIHHAREVKGRVEAIVSATASGIALDADTAGWLARVGDDLAAKLAAVGLIPDRQSMKLSVFLESYLAGRRDIKASTLRVLTTFVKRVLQFFPADTDLRAVTTGDGDEFASFLRSKYEPATAARTVKAVRTMFRHAVRKKLIPTNPMEGVKGGSESNMANWHFIDKDTADKVLAACPSAELRLVFALSRFGGLRCPSEIQLLTWADVLWDRDRLRVLSPKTEHHEGHGERFTPIFPELRPFLEAAFDEAEPGTVHLVRQYPNPLPIYRKQFVQILRRAGLVQWPRLFHNLRASRQTELTRVHPAHVVCAWLGNSERVAAKHYLGVTDEDFARAVSPSGAKSGAVGADGVQNPVQSAHGGKGQEMNEPPAGQGVSHADTVCDASRHNILMVATGFEPVTPSVSC